MTAGQRMAKVREEIEAAPHYVYCSVRYWGPSGQLKVHPSSVCNCWKSRALALTDGADKCETCGGSHKVIICCTCGEREGQQHKPRCQRQGLVANESAWHNLRSEIPCPDCRPKPKRLPDQNWCKTHKPGICDGTGPSCEPKEDSDG